MADVAGHEAPMEVDMEIDPPEEETVAPISQPEPASVPAQEPERKSERRPESERKARPSSQSKPQARPATNGTVTPKKYPKPSEREYPKDLLCKVRYKNTLPDIPFDAKLLAYPFDPFRYIRYWPSSVETSHKFDLISESNLNIPIDLIDPDAYRVPTNATLHKDDLALVEDAGEKEKANLKKKKRTHHMEVYWMRKTEWISSEHKLYGMTNEQIQARRARREQQAQITSKDRDSQVQAIKKTFDVVNSQKTWKHPTKKHLKAVDVMPLLPDSDNWGNVYSLVVFDNDPSPESVKPITPDADEETIRAWELNNARMSLGFLHGMQGANPDDQYVGYFVPQKATMRARQQMEDVGEDLAESSEKYRYDMVREYNFAVRTTTSQNFEKSYMLMTKGGAVHYNEITSRVMLRKRRVQDDVEDKTTHAMVSYRPFTSEERSNQNKRVRSLEAVDGDAEEDGPGRKRSRKDSSSSSSSDSDSDAGKSAKKGKGKKADSDSDVASP
eukprot:comp20919_c0_seq1/m.27903 comp20919_c0_seq1/g.27903  ORF comp20919_c0_seq1/g.27903 comp20919_c0_seq1/m.27903 type:complete len:500 (-) comp20919_c0_seq1:113-1612(-)